MGQSGQFPWIGPGQVAPRHSGAQGPRPTSPEPSTATRRHDPDGLPGPAGAEHVLGPPGGPLEKRTSSRAPDQPQRCTGGAKSAGGGAPAHPLPVPVPVPGPDNPSQPSAPLGSAVLCAENWGVLCEARSWVRVGVARTRMCGRPYVVLVRLCAPVLGVCARGHRRAGACMVCVGGLGEEGRCGCGCLCVSVWVSACVCAHRMGACLYVCCFYTVAHLPSVGA